MPCSSNWYATLTASTALFWNLGAIAEEPKIAPSAPTPTCDSVEYRQFDFWIGRWSVVEGEQPAGRNTIEPDLKRCALFESWTSVDGSRGRSINFYDRSRQRRSARARRGTGQWEHDSRGRAPGRENQYVRPAPYYLDTAAGWLCSPALADDEGREVDVGDCLRRSLQAQPMSPHYLRASTRNLRPPIDNSFHFGAAVDMLPLANSPSRSNLCEKSSDFALMAPTSTQ